MTFSEPLFLWLLALLPFWVWLGWPSRGPSRRRETLSLSVRLLIATTLILGLAGLEIRQPGRTLSVVFLVDASDSMRVPVQQAGALFSPLQLAEAYVRSALAALEPDEQAGVIVFGANAVIERPLSPDRESEAFTSQVIQLQSDLAGAVRLALALLPSDTARRVVLISDGAQTSGDLLSAARLAAASGTQLMVVPFSAVGGSETVLSAVRIPEPRLRVNERFGLEITVESTLNQRLGVRVFAGDTLVYDDVLVVRQGVNKLTLPLTARETGLSAYRVQLIPAAVADTFFQNNELATYVNVDGPPRFLLAFSSNTRDGVAGADELAAALQAGGAEVDTLNAQALPADLPSLTRYSSVVLVDVPARDLTNRQMTTLQTFVRDFGGGLVVVGGPTSYGVGGYYRTPLETVLPVEMTLKDEQRRAGLTMVFVIDKSGSMADTTSGVQNVELAKEAVARSIQLLSPNDRVGVIAFDDVARWVVPIRPLDDLSAIINQVGTIRADGGTDIMAGLSLAAQDLPADESPIKHIILLTDGMSDPTGIPELVRRLNRDNAITLSSVGLGGSETAFLNQLAQEGGGKFHAADDAARIPTIFAEETALASRSYIIEETFFPEARSASPMLNGVTSVPALLGYVGTTARPAAQVILVNPRDRAEEGATPDPILATWRYGLGRTVAWTSDATGRWAKNWVSWDVFARFWQQVVRATVGDDAPTAAAVEVTERDDGRAFITLEAQDRTGAFSNGLALQATVLAPGGLSQTVRLAQVAPGRYTASFAPQTQGVYIVRVTDEAETVNASTGWVLAYSPEYQLPVSADDPTLVTRLGAETLARAASLTGGGTLSATEPRAAYDRAGLSQPPGTAQPLWPLLLLLAALLWPVDIALRRLTLSRTDVRQAWARSRGWGSLARPAPVAPTPERVEQMASLRRAKERASQDTPPVTPAVTRVNQPPAVPPVSTQPPPAPPAAPPASATGNTASSLLAKKRARQDDASRTE